jgi:hydrogenase maturation factor HypF (carbamoyltransferase family)
MVTEQVCTDCGARFETGDALARHRSETSHSDVYKCDQCADEFTSQDALEAHLATGHGAETEPPIR